MTLRSKDLGPEKALGLMADKGLGTLRHTSWPMINSIRLKENNYVPLDTYVSTKKRHQLLRFLQRILKLNV